MNSITFIYFDVGGVLLRWRGVLDKIAKRYNKPLADIERVFNRYDDQSCRGEIDPVHYWQKMIAEMDVPKKGTEDLLSICRETFTPILPTHALMKKLIRTHRVGLLTNIHHGFYDMSIQEGHIPDLPYAVVVQSCNIGMIKPEKEIFLHAQKQANVPHHQILFIDDYEANILAARAFGWKTVLFNTDSPKESITAIKKHLNV